MENTELSSDQLRVLNESKAELVRKGEEIGKRAFEIKSEGWTHQVRRLLGVASEENEPLVLLNLLRYQSVRNEKSWGKDRSKVAEPMEAAMKWCKTEAGSDSALAMVLIQHLLCYAYRSHTFESGRDVSKEKTASEKAVGQGVPS